MSKPNEPPSGNPDPSDEPSEPSPAGQPPPPAESEIDWACQRIFDGQGRIIQETRFAVVKGSCCPACRGTGRVVLFTTANDCSKCLGSGKVPAEFAAPVTYTYYEISPEGAAGE